MPQDTAAACLQLVLDGALTMRTVEPVRATLRAAIEPPSGVARASIVIDCSAATEIDLTFIQLLIAMRLSAQNHGVEVSLAPCPDGGLLDTLTRGGFRVVREDGAGAFWFAGEAP